MMIIFKCFYKVEKHSSNHQERFLILALIKELIVNLLGGVFSNFPFLPSH